MVNRSRMGRNKSTMTGGAVAANAKGLSDCKADQLALVPIMTIRAGIMRLRVPKINQWWRIAMAAGAVSGTYLDQG